MAIKKTQVESTEAVAIDTAQVDDIIIDKKIAFEIPPENDVKKRKPREPKAGRPAKFGKNEVEILAGQIEAAHKIAALVTGTQELEIATKEAEMLAGAIAEVLAQHTIVVDPKLAAYINLMSVAAMVYGPRGYAIYARKKAAYIAPSRQPEPKYDDQPTANVNNAGPQPAPNGVDELASELNYDDELSTF
jgi:hypothetical protein